MECEFQQLTVVRHDDLIACRELVGQESEKREEVF